MHSKLISIVLLLLVQFSIQSKNRTQNDRSNKTHRIVKELVYYQIKEFMHCVKYLNKDGEYGCVSENAQMIGVLIKIDNNLDLERISQENQNFIGFVNESNNENISSIVNRTHRIKNILGNNSIITLKEAVPNIEI